MRTIKFRAWHKLEKTMGTVQVLTIGEGAFVAGIKKGHNTHPIEIATGKPDRDAVIIAPENGRFCRLAMLEIMQYIGQKDVNGVEIYEGDICRQHFNGHEIVAPMIWNANLCQFGLDANLDFDPGTDHIEIKIPKNTAPEVIGNIYENKELLDAVA